jgi:hypothetical protein
MRTTSFIVPIVALLLLGSLPGRAFSLLGPFSGWQSPDLGYNIPNAANEYGGPRLRGDEYRLGAPVVTYGIDGSFLEFFGVEGAQAVDAAFAVFNGLTNVSAFSETLDEFPLKADGINPTARALGLIDIKTQLMSQIPGHHGAHLAGTLVLVAPRPVRGGNDTQLLGGQLQLRSDLRSPFPLRQRDAVFLRHP